MNYKEIYNLWLNKVNEEEKKELLAIEGNEEEIKDRFYKSLEFGKGSSLRSCGKRNKSLYIL